MNIQHALKAEAKQSLKEKAQELMKIEGEMRGELLKSNFAYLEKKEGKKAVERMEKRLEDIGYPLKFQEIESFKWYKDAFCAVFMMLFKDEFNWTEKDIFDLGRFSPQYSIIIKITLRYLVSMKKTFDLSQNLWSRNVNYGNLEPYIFNDKEKYMILRFKNYALTPLVCIYIRGYLTSLFEHVVGRDKALVEETKCIFNNHDFHEFKITWK